MIETRRKKSKDGGGGLREKSLDVEPESFN
jgi:hypothetical protein